MDERYFALPDTSSDDVNRGNEFYISHVVKLAQKCWDYHEKAPGANISSSAKQTLYTGSLGPCVYLRYRLATSPFFPRLTAFHKQSADGDADEDAIIRASSIRMLRDAMSVVDGILFERARDHSAARTPRVSLLEGELVGALALKIVIGDAIVSLTDAADRPVLIREIESAMKKLLMIGRDYVLSGLLSESECEVLYGRCGYLKAIKFIQTEIGDPTFGNDVAGEIVQEVWVEGKQDVDPNSVIKNIKQLRVSLPLIWKWKGKVYLGACHGITGILHTLLDFQDALTSFDEDSMEYIEATTALLRENMCTESGNLASSLKSSGSAKKSDVLVQWCHGAPGHVLLLTQMARKTQNETYLEVAKDLTASVIKPRGLLRKGVGLCHGISGNAFSFLSVSMAERDLYGDAHSASSKWINATYEYANFALDHLSELETTPDRPFSLFEGVTGLSCLLLALLEGGKGPNSKFPLFEV